MDLKLLKLDPLLLESIKNLIGGLIYSVALLLSSAFLNWLIIALNLQDTAGINLFLTITTYGSMFIFALVTLKSFMDMIILSIKSIKKTWKR